jgi:hypothetical protein
MWNPCQETTFNGILQVIMRKGPPQAQGSGEARQIFYPLSSPIIRADVFFYPNKKPKPTLIIDFHSDTSTKPMIAIVKRTDNTSIKYRIPERTGCDIEFDNSADLDSVEVYSV